MDRGKEDLAAQAADTVPTITDTDFQYHVLVDGSTYPAFEM